jgi:GT2 family glycosyltransferase
VPPITSVVIPSRDRPRQLARCLEALAASDCARHHFEVIVVDDGGLAPLEPAVRGWAERLALRVIRQPNAGPAAARNTGAAAAAGRLLAFTDDDCLPDPGWLPALSRQADATPERLLGGRTINALPGNPYASASQAIVDVVYRHYNSDPEHPRFFASNNMAVPADLFARIGGFSPSFRTSEDRELCDRWLATGRDMAYVPDAIVRHAHDLSAAAFWRQHFSYGQGAYRFQTQRAARDPRAMRRDLRFHANVGNWLGSPFRERHHHALTVAALLCVWQIANASGFLYESWSTRWRRGRGVTGAADPPA